MWCRRRSCRSRHDSGEPLAAQNQDVDFAYASGEPGTINRSASRADARACDSPSSIRPEQGRRPPVAISLVPPGDLAQSHHRIAIVSRMGLIAWPRSTHPGQQAATRFRQPSLLQEADRHSSQLRAYHFVASSSLSACTCRSRSARSRFSLAFSVVSSFGRWTSLVSEPPYVRRQR